MPFPLSGAMDCIRPSRAEETSGRFSLMLFHPMLLHAFYGPHITPARLASCNLGTSYSLRIYRFVKVCGRMLKPNDCAPRRLLATCDEKHTSRSSSKGFWMH